MKKMSDITLELTLPENIYLTLKSIAEQSDRAPADVVLSAIQSYLDQVGASDPIIGLFGNEPEVVDQVIADIMDSRQNTPLRLNEVEVE